MRCLTRMLACLLALSLLFSCASCKKEDPPAEGMENPTLSVWTLDLGKADCILLKTEDFLMVVDTGTKDAAGKVVDAVRSLGRTVNALVLTHYDKDHIGGLEKLLKKTEIRDVFLPVGAKDDEKQEVLEKLSDCNLIPTVVEETTLFEGGGMKIALYPTSLDLTGEGETDRSDESSLAVYVTHGDNTFLLPGDAVGERLPEIVTQLGGKGVTWLKVPHHGTFDENSEAFFTALSPRYAIVTCSGTARPDQRVLTSLERIGTAPYLTLSGTVLTESDGKEMRVRYINE